MKLTSGNVRLLKKFAFHYFYFLFRHCCATKEAYSHLFYDFARSLYPRMRAARCTEPNRTVYRCNYTCSWREHELRITISERVGNVKVKIIKAFQKAGCWIILVKQATVQVISTVWLILMEMEREMSHTKVWINASNAHSTHYIRFILVCNKSTNQLHPCIDWHLQ